MNFVLVVRVVTFSKDSKGDPFMAPAKSTRKQRGDKQEQAGGAQCIEAPVSCRGLRLPDFVVEGSQAGESQAGSLQALAHAAGELHAQEHLQQVASVAPSGSARLRRAAAPLPGVYEGHDVEIEDSASEEYGAKQLQRDLQSQSQSGGDEEGQQGDELAGQGGESEQAEGQGEQEDVDGMVEGRSAREGGSKGCLAEEEEVCPLFRH